MLLRGPRGVRETGGAIFGRCSEERPQPLPGWSWVLRGGGSALTIPGMGSEAVVGAGMAYFNALLCTTLMQAHTLRGAREPSVWLRPDPSWPASPPPSHPLHPLRAMKTPGGSSLACKQLEMALKAVSCAQGCFLPQLPVESRG